MARARATLLLAGLCAASIFAVGSARAGAATAASRSGDAGYAVTGRHLSFVESWVRLPEPWRYAREMGRIGASLQLWTARRVIDLKVTACTDATCRPGGRPMRHSYHAVVSVYDRQTHALICSTAAAGSLRCPNTSRAFRRARFTPGHKVQLNLIYTVPWISVFADAGNYEYDYPIAPSASGRPTVNFTNGRICAELGDTPWSSPLLRAPRAAIPLMSFDRPPPPPYYAEVGNLDDKNAGIAAPWWGHHVVATAPRSPYATAGRLWDDGYGLTVYLRP